MHVTSSYSGLDYSISTMTGQALIRVSCFLKILIYLLKQQWILKFFLPIVAKSLDFGGIRHIILNIQLTFTLNMRFEINRELIFESSGGCLFLKKYKLCNSGVRDKKFVERNSKANEQNFIRTLNFSLSKIITYPFLVETDRQVAHFFHFFHGF